MKTLTINASGYSASGYKAPPKNGGSLEECYTNVFALTELNGLKWRCFVTPTSAPRGVPVTSDFVLKAYGKCLKEGYLCTWRRKPLPLSVKTETLKNPSFTNDISKELWCFWYTSDPPAKLLEITAQLENDDEIEMGSASNGIPYEIRILFFKALHAIVERTLLGAGYIRFGRWFTRPLVRDTKGFGYEFLTPSHRFAFNLQFFVHGGNIVCMTLNFQRQPTLLALSKRHFSQTEKVQVVLSPWSLRGFLVPTGDADYSKIQASTQRQWNEWEEYVPLRENNKTEVNPVPKMVVVEVDEVRMLYPTSLIGITLKDDEKTWSDEVDKIKEDVAEIKTRNHVNRLRVYLGLQSIIEKSFMLHMAKKKDPFRKPFSAQPVDVDESLKFSFHDPIANCLDKKCKCCNFFNMLTKKEEEGDTESRPATPYLDFGPTFAENPAFPGQKVRKPLGKLMSKVFNRRKWKCPVDWRDDSDKDSSSSESALPSDSETMSELEEPPILPATNSEEPDRCDTPFWARTDKNTLVTGVDFDDEEGGYSSGPSEEDALSPKNANCDPNANDVDRRMQGEKAIKSKNATSKSKDRGNSSSDAFDSIRNDYNMMKKQSKKTIAAPTNKQPRSAPPLTPPPPPPPPPPSPPKTKTYANEPLLRMVPVIRKALKETMVNVVNDVEYEAMQFSNKRSRYIWPDLEQLDMDSITVNAAEDFRIKPKMYGAPFIPFKEEDDSEPDVFESEESDSSDNERRNMGEGRSMLADITNRKFTDEPMEVDNVAYSILSPPASNEQMEGFLPPPIIKLGPPSIGESLNKIYPTPPSMVGEVQQLSPMDVMPCQNNTDQNAPKTEPMETDKSCIEKTLKSSSETEDKKKEETTVGLSNQNGIAAPCAVSKTCSIVGTAETNSVKSSEEESHIKERKKPKKLRMIKKEDDYFHIDQNSKVFSFYNSTKRKQIANVSPRTKLNLTGRFIVQKNERLSAILKRRKLPLDYEKLKEKIKSEKKPEKSRIQLSMEAILLAIHKQQIQQFHQNPNRTYGNTNNSMPEYGQRPMQNMPPHPGMMVPGYPNNPMMMRHGNQMMGRGVPPQYANPGQYMPQQMGYGQPQMGPPGYCNTMRYPMMNNMGHQIGMQPMPGMSMGQPGMNMPNQVGMPHMGQMQAMEPGGMGPGPMMPAPGSMNHMNMGPMGHSGPVNIYGGPPSGQMGGINSPYNSNDGMMMHSAYSNNPQNFVQPGPYPMNPNIPPTMNSNIPNNSSMNSMAMRAAPQQQTLIDNQSSSNDDVVVLKDTAPAEGSSIVLALLFQDTLLDLFYDTVFDSCPVCSCNASIKSRELGLYVIPPELLKSSPEVQANYLSNWGGFVGNSGSLCNCGFSVVRHRYLSLKAGLFYEDAYEATGNRDAGCKANPMWSTNYPRKLFFNSQNLNDRRTLNLIRTMSMSTFLGRQAETIISFMEYTEKMRRAQKLSYSIETGSDYLLSLIDCSELLLIGNQTLDLSLVNGSRNKTKPPAFGRKYMSIFHPWGLQVANEAECLGELEISDVTRHLTPHLEKAMRIVRCMENNASFNIVEGPLTWKALTSKIQKISPTDDDVHAPEPVPFILLGCDKELIRASPLILPFWDDLNLAPYDHPKDVLYLTVMPENNLLDLPISNYMDELSKTYEKMKLGRHISWNLKDVKDGIVRVGGKQYGKGFTDDMFEFLKRVDNTDEKHQKSIQMIGLFTQEMEEKLVQIINENQEMFARSTYRQALALDQRNKKAAMNTIQAEAEKVTASIQEIYEANPNATLGPSSESKLISCDFLHEITYPSNPEAFDNQFFQKEKTEEEGTKETENGNNVTNSNGSDELASAQTAIEISQQTAPIPQATIQQIKSGKTSTTQTASTTGLPAHQQNPNISQGTLTSQPTSVPSAQGTVASQAQQAPQGPLQELLDSSQPGLIPITVAPRTIFKEDPPLEAEDTPVDDHGTLNQVVVIYVINPFNYGDEGKTYTLARLGTLAIMRAFNAVLGRIPPSLRLQLQLEIVPLSRSLHLAGLSEDFYLCNEMISDYISVDIREEPREFTIHEAVKAACFSVYRAPRYFTPKTALEVKARCMTKFGPGSDLLEIVADWEKLAEPVVYSFPTNSHILAPLPWLRQETTNNGESKVVMQPGDEEINLFITYCLVGNDYLCAVIGDSRGRIHDNCVINMRPDSDDPNEAIRYKAKTQILDVMTKLWNFIQATIAMDTKAVRLVIGRLGKIGHGEFKAWSHILTKTTLRKMSAKMKETCTACFETPGPAGIPTILSACLISTEPEPYLRLHPKLVNVDGLPKKKTYNHTPGDFSCTHILVFPVNTQIELSGGEQATEDENYMDAWDGIAGLDLPQDDEFGNIQDIVGGLDNADTSGQQSASFRSNGSGLFSSDLSEPLQNQPLAIGYLISTCPAPDLPEWFWQNSPSSRRQIPIHLKSSLHINVQCSGTDQDQGEELIQQSKTVSNDNLEKIHPLDSQRTDEVLRHVLKTYNALSWLNIDVRYGDRYSCLPIHFQVLLRLYHSLFRLVT
ncbi:unnamed protein product [Auanema sp. JU1783]|nr:unnamed protein product [Auanema sp. JU1783]